MGNCPGLLDSWILAGSEKELRSNHPPVAGRASLVAPGSDDFRALAEQTLRRVPWMRRVFLDDCDPRAGLRTDQLDRLGEEIAIVRIRLDA